MCSIWQCHLASAACAQFSKYIRCTACYLLNNIDPTPGTSCVLAKSCVANSIKPVPDMLLAKHRFLYATSSSTSMRHSAGEGKTGSACGVETLRALNAALTAVPTAFRSHHKALDSFACSLLATDSLTIEQRREAAHCCAAINKVKGQSGSNAQCHA